MDSNGQEIDSALIDQIKKILEKNFKKIDEEVLSYLIGLDVFYF